MQSSSDITVCLDDFICLLMALFKPVRFFHQMAFRVIFGCLIGFKMKR